MDKSAQVTGHQGSVHISLIKTKKTIFSFDHLQSAKLFYDHINYLNTLNLQQVNTFPGLTYIETPQLNH
jgi:hypothetical protein